MTDEHEPTPEPCPPNGWVKLYHPKGPLVTIPVNTAMETLDYDAMLANVTAMLDAGWLVQAPGLEEGEHKDEVGYVVKSYVGEDGTPAIDVYPAHEAAHYSLMRVYLNTPEQQQAFEYAAKVKLDSLPEYVGVGRLERGKSPQTDKLFHKLAKPIGIVWKDNPKYNPDETDATKKKPKRLFVRWADEKPKAAEHKEEPTPATPFEPPPPAPPKKKTKIVDPKVHAVAMLGCTTIHEVASIWQTIPTKEMTEEQRTLLTVLKDDMKHLVSVLPVIETTTDIATLDALKTAELRRLKTAEVQQKLRDALYARTEQLQQESEVPV